MSIRRIAFCTDFSANAGAAFETALDMAKKYGARLSIVHVVPQESNPLLPRSGRPSDAPPESLVREIQERIERKYLDHIGGDVETDCAILDGHVSTEILKYLGEKDIDLAVMGSYGLAGVGLAVFGSVARRVVHKSPCSVLIVRRKETESR